MEMQNPLLTRRHSRNGVLKGDTKCDTAGTLAQEAGFGFSALLLAPNSLL